MADYPGWLSGEKDKLEAEVRRRQLGRVAEHLRREIQRMDLDDTGRLMRSIRVDERAGTVTMDAPYSKFVNDGRRPGRAPPYEQIHRWVGHKLGITQPKRSRNVTWAIMMKIKKKGIPGTWILERAWKRALR